MPTYTNPWNPPQSYNQWNLGQPWSAPSIPQSTMRNTPTQPWSTPLSSGGYQQVPANNFNQTIPGTQQIPNQSWFGGNTPPPVPSGPPAFPTVNYGQWQTPVTGFTPYVPPALQSDPATWRNRLANNGQAEYNEAMRQLRLDQAQPPTGGTQEEYQAWQVQMQERANQIERDYENAQTEYGQAWNEYVSAKAFNLIPYLGDSDRSYIANMVGAVVPGTQPVESTASDGTRADDRNLQLKDRWAAVRQGLEWGNQLFGNQTDPDPRSQDRFEQSQQFLNEVANIGEQYGLNDTAHDFRRWQLQDRASAYNNLKSAYAPMLDERVITLADTLFNPSQAGSAPSPMAQQLGGRYTRPNAGGNTGRQSANWAYRNSSLM